MRTLAVMVVALTATTASADPQFELHAGVGAPAGGSGIGFRSGRVEVLAELQFLPAMMVLVFGYSAHVNVDVLTGPRVDLYVGAMVGHLDVLILGYEGDGSDTYRGAGGAFGIRLRKPNSRWTHAIELGAFAGQCRQRTCSDGQEFVSIELAYRAHFRL